MTDEEKCVLVACLTRETEIAATPNPPKHRRWEKRELDELRQHGPRFSIPLWFGDPETGYIPERFRSRFLRATWRLVDAGMLRATRTGCRLSHVKLAAEGRKVAEALSQTPTESTN